MTRHKPSLLEVQFPIGPLSIESYIERDAKGAKLLSSLGKWWGGKPLVLTRAIILASLFESSDDPDQWPEDLEVFLRLMCFDPAGMWKRKKDKLPASICYPHATDQERKKLFKDEAKWSGKRSNGVPEGKEALEKRVFYTLPYTEQLEYCCRVEQIDGPPKESWAEINAYCGTSATSLSEWVEEMSLRRFGHKLRVGDAFSGSGSIPFEAAELGCDVYASDLNPVACLLSWGALNLVGGDPDYHAEVGKAQQELYEAMDAWYEETGYETSEEGWRAEAYLYCVEVTVPEWDGWKIPLSGSWEIAPKLGAWVELIPDEANKRFDFKVRYGGKGFRASKKGTKQGQDVVCPKSLWTLLVQDGKAAQSSRQIPLKTLLANHGGLRKWERDDIRPREGDFYGERLYCIRWRELIRKPNGEIVDEGDLIYREPTAHDLQLENAIAEEVQENLTDWQEEGWIPSWRIQEGAKTREVIRTRGWTHWHHLFTPRQLRMAAEYSHRIGDIPAIHAPKVIMNFGRLLDANCRLCRWLQTQGGGIGGTKTTFYNQALNTFYNYAGRGLSGLAGQLRGKMTSIPSTGSYCANLVDARQVVLQNDLWITDPPYADAVNYEELSEFFLAWYQPHLKYCFPEWYTDSRRDTAVKGDDAPFRVAMAECYERLCEKMPENGMQVLMFTHKDTDVWEDLALIMWAAGLQVKQVWSVATETPGAGIRVGNYVQATYNMVLRKRPAAAPMGFVDLVHPQIKQRVQEVISHMRDSQLSEASVDCGYTDTDYLLAAQAVAAEVVTGFSSIDGIDLEEELRTPNKQRGNSVLREMMNQAKRVAVDFLVPVELESQLRRSPDGTTAYQFWRSLAPEEKFLLKALELEAGDVSKVGAFQDLGRAYGLSQYEALLGKAEANDAHSVLPTDLARVDSTTWNEVVPTERGRFEHSVTRHIYHAIKLLTGGAEVDRAVKHLVDCTNFWQDRQSKHLVILGYLYHVTETIPHWQGLRPTVQVLRLAVENHRG